MSIARSLLVLLVSLVPIAACGGPGDPPSKPDPRYASAEEIGFACGGGFTGAWDGRTLKRDGSVEVWSSGDGSTAMLESTWSIPAAKADEFFRALEAARFLALEKGEPGNMGCALRLEGPAFLHEVHWSDETRPLPPAVAAVVERLRALKEKP